MNCLHDIENMHHKFGVYDWLDDATPAEKQELMKLRMRMLMEEFTETMNAYITGDAEEFVDGLTDICVIAIGTMDIANVDAYTAWAEVMDANMDKEAGVKPGRPNPLGLPDLLKPSGWTGPDHSSNLGNLKAML